MHNHFIIFFHHLKNACFLLRPPEIQPCQFQYDPQNQRSNNQPYKSSGQRQ